MNEAVNAVELALHFVETAAVAVGVLFGLIQLRQLRQQREVTAGVELLRPLQSLETMEAVLLIHDLPDGLDGEALHEALGVKFGSVMALMATFESLGPLVARGYLPIEMYAEFYRGATVVTWTKLERYVGERREAGWANLFEWVQWLAERMKERAPLDSHAPAFERLRDWRHSGDYRRLSGSEDRVAR